MTRIATFAVAGLLAACSGAAPAEEERSLEELAALAAEIAEEDEPSSLERRLAEGEEDEERREAERNDSLRTPPAEIVECGTDDCDDCRADLEAAGIPSIEARCEPRGCEVDADCATLSPGFVCADPGGPEATGERQCRRVRLGAQYSCDLDADGPGSWECETGLACSPGASYASCRPAGD